MHSLKALTPISTAYSTYNTSLKLRRCWHQPQPRVLRDGHHGLHAATVEQLYQGQRGGGGVIGDIDWDKVANRTVYIGPDAYSLYSTSFGVLQAVADGNEAPIRFEIFYNLIK